MIRAAALVGSLVLASALTAFADTADGHGQGHQAMPHPTHEHDMTGSIHLAVSDGDPQSINNQLMAEKGIEILSLRLTADGTMIDYRYRVTNADSAASLHGQHVKTHILHDATQKQFEVPFASKVGSLRQTSKPPVQDRVYVVLFANPGRIAQHGDTITISQSDLMISGIRVE